MKKALIFLVRAYQFILSPLLRGLGGGCRFYPSCSEYFRMGVEKYRMDKALLLIFRRIAKCHPWHAGGVDIP